MATKIPGTTPRPRCALCGKPYGTRDIQEERIFWPDGEPRPAPYQGNAILIAEEVDPSDESYAAGTRAIQGGGFDARTGRHENGTPGRVITRRTWDGESYWRTQCAPFCGNACAIAFAQAAYRDGARYTLKREG